MPYKIKTDLKNIDWNELSDVYERAPLGARDPSQLQRAFEKSYYTCIIMDKEKPLAAGRIISDGEYYANIYDIAVLPEYQDRGIGKLIMDHLLSEIDKLFILLTSTEGNEPFYQKLGFRKHKTAMAIYPKGKEENAKKYLHDSE